MTEEKSVDEVVCSGCEHPSTYRLYFIDAKMFSKCVLCGSEYDLEDALLARAESLAPPPPPPPPVPVKKKLFNFGRKKDTTVKSPA